MEKNLKNYSAPEVQVINMAENDVICVSGQTNTLFQADIQGKSISADVVIR